MEYEENQSEQKVQEDLKTTIENIDISTIEAVSAPKEDLIDFDSYKFKPIKIEKVEVIRMPSKFAKAEDGMQHKIKLISEVVETVVVNDKPVEIRASTLLNCVEDADGKFLGLSDNEKSQWNSLKKALKIQKIADAVGKELPMEVNESKTGSKFLGLLY